ncbi:hypothetical protein IC575_007080 [Cucumis melo]|uniref:Serine/arginine repetitive matrix protein 1 n=1 Tax=Cucumis melo TaxID=3656 RepID=A0A1S3BBU4_CUCME|nr:uncharacterized protein LOC103488229 [Cucumis melo]
MATTRSKESGGLGKERRITPPSSVTIPNNTPTKRTPKSSPRGFISSTDPKVPSFSSSSPSPSSAPTSLSILPEKPVPNYLKSTASSRNDHNFKPITRSKSGPAPIPEGKPSLNRRRSFDKPPPTAPRLEKPFRSPGPRNRATHVPVRSSSFGAKPSTSTTIIGHSTKPGFLERSSSKISKVGGKPQPPIQSLKTSSSHVKKSLRRESSNVAASASASASAEIVPKTKNAVEHVDQSPSFVLGVNEEDLKKIECELDPYLPDPMPELDKQVRIDQVEKKAALDKDETDTEILKVVVTNKEVEEKETPGTAETEISLANREQNEGEEEEPKEEDKPKRIGVEKEEVLALEESINNKNDQEKSETDSVLDGESCKEENDQNSTPKAAETTEKEAESTEKTAKPRQGAPGRKESPAVYNHVIEETASKLLEKRKNKVRALAGAFQTVIDYESSSK